MGENKCGIFVTMPCFRPFFLLFAYFFVFFTAGGTRYTHTHTHRKRVGGATWKAGQGKTHIHRILTTKRCSIYFGEQKKSQGSSQARALRNSVCPQLGGSVPGAGNNAVFMCCSSHPSSEQNLKKTHRFAVVFELHPDGHH